MSLIGRILYPCFACFGPLFLVFGLQGQGRSPIDHALALAGAFLVIGALLLLYAAVLRIGAPKS